MFTQSIDSTCLLAVPRSSERDRTSYRSYYDYLVQQSSPRSLTEWVRLPSRFKQQTVSKSARLNKVQTVYIHIIVYEGKTASRIKSVALFHCLPPCKLAQGQSTALAHRRLQLIALLQRDRHSDTKPHFVRSFPRQNLAFKLRRTSLGGPLSSRRCC